MITMPKYKTFQERISKSGSRRRGKLNENPGIMTTPKETIIRGGNVGISDRPIISAVDGTTIDNLFDLLKESPEYVGVVRALIHDIMAEAWDFQGSDINKRRAMAFDKKSKYFWKLSNALWDFFNYGDAFILKLAVPEKDIDAFIEANASTTNLVKKYGKKTVKEFFMKQIRQNKIRNLPKDLQVLDSRTIYPINDDTGRISSWKQEVPGKERIIFKDDDIIHLTINNIGGRVFGFTPAHTLLKDILTLAFAKDYAAKVFENDALPSGMFNFPNVNPDDTREVDFLEDQLKVIRQKANKLRTIITTGEVKYNELKTLGQEMEFKDLIVHFTMIIMFAWGMPAHRLPMLMQRTTNFPKESNDGYFKQISFMQRILETHLNDDLWNEFGVEKIFNRAYRIDELREANIAAIIADRQLATTSEIRVRYLKLPPSMPDGQMPGNLKQQAFNFFNENRDDRLVSGDDSDLMTDETPPEGRDNKLR